VIKTWADINKKYLPAKSVLLLCWVAMLELTSLEHVEPERVLRWVLKGDRQKIARLIFCSYWGFHCNKIIKCSGELPEATNTANQILDITLIKWRL